MGAVNDIWQQLENNKGIKEAIMMRMEEMQLKEERMERQRVAKST